jgi:hypothetical protein
MAPTNDKPLKWKGKTKLITTNRHNMSGCVKRGMIRLSTYSPHGQTAAKNAATVATVNNQENIGQLVCLARPGPWADDDPEQDEDMDAEMEAVKDKTKDKSDQSQP